MNSSRQNLLEMVPEKKTKESSRNLGCIRFEFNRFNSAAGRLFGKLFGSSKAIGLTLDERSTYVWDLIDGQRSVEQIVSVMTEHYGGEPGTRVMELGQLLTTLEKNRLIRFLR